MEFVRLNALVGGPVACLGISPDTLPRAGLYIASGSFGKLDMELLRLKFGVVGALGVSREGGGAGISRGPFGFGRGNECVLMRGSCPGEG